MKKTLRAAARVLWCVMALAVELVRAVLVALIAALFGWRYGSR